MLLCLVMIVIKICYKFGGMVVFWFFGVIDLVLFFYFCDFCLEIVFYGFCKIICVCGFNSFIESSVYKNGYVFLSVVLCIIVCGIWKIF